MFNLLQQFLGILQFDNIDIVTFVDVLPYIVNNIMVLALMISFINFVKYLFTVFAYDKNKK